jgi:hypothetical protein
MTEPRVGKTVALAPSCVLLERSPTFRESRGESMIRELWPGPERSLSLILRLARPGGDSEADALG